jgi:hypothetical protein
MLGNILTMMQLSVGLARDNFDMHVRHIFRAALGLLARVQDVFARKGWLGPWRSESGAAYASYA